MPEKISEILKKVISKGAEVKEAKKGVADKETEPENALELTPKYDKAKENMKKNLEATSEDTKEDKVQGISINKKDMKATPKTFVRKVIKSGGENGTTKILSDDGKSVKFEGRSNMKATQDAVKQNESQTTDTNSRREYNANNYNRQSGSKENLDSKDKESLIGLGKAKKINAFIKPVNKLASK